MAAGLRRLYASSTTNFTSRRFKNSSTRTSHGVSVAAAVAAAAAELEACAVPEPELSAAHLTAAVLGDGGLFPRVPTMHNTMLSAPETARLDSYVARRMAREPVQQIVGEWEFHEILLETAPGILVPRPETEELVEFCLRDLQVYAGKKKKLQRQEAAGAVETAGCCDGNLYCDVNATNLRVLDVGVGTGAIGLALLNAYGEDLHVDGIDLDHEAVALSLRNAIKVGVGSKYQCFEMDVSDAGDLIGTLPTPSPATNASAFLDAGSSDDTSRASLYDMIVSNPPYIPEADASTMQPEVLLYERGTALFSGDFGMDCIEVLLSVAPGLLAPGGSLWIEVDPSHPPLIEQAAAKSRSLRYVGSCKDFRGLERFVHLVKR